MNRGGEDMSGKEDEVFKFGPMISVPAAVFAEPCIVCGKLESEGAVRVDLYAFVWECDHHWHDAMAKALKRVCDHVPQP